jgi:hypothetical protein
MSTFIFFNVICNSSGSEYFMSKKQTDKICGAKIFFDFDNIHNMVDLRTMKLTNNRQNKQFNRLNTFYW